jgi:hypothetical protein
VDHAKVSFADTYEDLVAGSTTIDHFWANAKKWVTLREFGEQLVG